MMRYRGLGLLVMFLLSTSFAQQEYAHEWPRSLQTAVSGQEFDESIQAYVEGAMDMAYIALVQASFDRIPVPTEADSDRLASYHAACVGSLADTELQLWLTRSHDSALPVVEVIFDAAIAACSSDHAD